MRANLEISFSDKLEVPIQYNYLVQAMILNWLGDEKYQKFIHDKGYEYNNRSYKMYTFSKLYGKFSVNSKNGIITFFDKVNLIVSSLDTRFIQYLASNVIMEDNLRLGKNSVKVNKIETSYNELGNSEKIYTKSPITVYSTLQNADKKKTYYYSPYEEEFNELIRNNLINKYKALYNKFPQNDSFDIKLLSTREPKESVLNYKGTIIKGWNGEFLIKGSKELLQIAYDAGLGSKNSQGFGCIELKK
ncbi:CRISPR-associated endoribonuclease Cas6 [Clostridium cochlearium]|uniref:CRISPR-associated endoribonuclease Cas6 n=1 Tax=Clostridium cochlearium TaxID=1494 RepID=UPI000B946913|nr:CRISPR-associated endoribonuclease Cas6 [Clostridium cochlearium]NME96473.1 CRISPR-associated endoribonuclease Cas6 [Clostridium cochlearium]SNV74847.1 CRISPR-associated Cas family protein [Clostridium cochlearium]STA92346.1 CRISPR-associated Cas family protein [Clostridium cochlearium]